MLVSTLLGPMSDSESPDTLEFIEQLFDPAAGCADEYRQHDGGLHEAEAVR